MKIVVRSEPVVSLEWPARLDIEDLRREGWSPKPFRQIVIKLHSLCNLSCDYCYVYRSPDQGWRRQPRRMSDATIRQVGHRLAEHAQDHGLSRMDVILHGGEPLLAGPAYLSFVVRALREAGRSVGCAVRLTAQTNGTLISERILRVLAEHDVRLSVSFDGNAHAHDVHRVRPDGRGSYAELVRGITLLREQYADLFAGLLCVVDLDNEPVETYENLLEFHPPTLDLLLPHAHWGAPPVRPRDSATAYGDWLIAVFDRWYGAPTRETSVRYFDEILRTVFGRPSRIETIGLSPASVVVVETDGAIEQTDALKAAYDGAAHTGLDIFQHPLNAALNLPQLAVRQMGRASLSSTCSECEVWRTCGGGFYPHRYLPGSGFLNPSVYCADLKRLIRHIQTVVQADIAARLAAAPASGER